MTTLAAEVEGPAFMLLAGYRIVWVDLHPTHRIRSSVRHDCSPHKGGYRFWVTLLPASDYARETERSTSAEVVGAMRISFAPCR